MHLYDAEIDRVAGEIIEYARWRTRLDPIPLDRTCSLEALTADAGQTITEAGLGGHEALRIFQDVLAPNCLSVDFPRYLAFVPCAPTELAVLFDLVVSAFSIYGGSWLEGAGAVYAENQALRWLADLAGLPAGAGGCFVAGGTFGNLSALVAARHTAEATRGRRPRRWAIIAAETAHSSIEATAQVMDAELIRAEVDVHGRLHGASVAKALGRARGRAFAVVATAGTTNLGLVDDLESIADVCGARDVWLHVDGAYGGAGLAAPSTRHLFTGVEHADSIIIDPHKWLFAPFDACALLYRDPSLAYAAHAHHASYLEILQMDHQWNPSDYAIHLTRRARGLPFWFSLASHGTRAYEAAVEQTIQVTREAAALVAAEDHLELVVEPMLSVLALRRVGWSEDQYVEWSARLLRDGTAFVVPSRHLGEPMLRLCIVNPRTCLDDIRFIFDSLR
ncbi:MAG TPA: pyridoxal-dependent decarboxylase [Acidimicrobiales bacterium]|jgi:glutamate/tyrosine decarboxylase-like PLP-dependent enzyme|nr:pyridoxal-dependent decarboxylase [Acidimicrobiales bacterium]